jgi:Holliday junction resolvasome RuvABC endonuclease subunit|tara:strand:- start:641 stop:1162 length:522 start_codon:yes stop_codon:yes gene_type:complete
MIVLGIDPGIKNMGYSVYDTEAKCFLSFGKIDLTENVDKKNKTKYSHLVKKVIDGRPDIFGNFDYIAIETQMIAKMKTVATAFQCFFWNKSVMVSPLALRKHFQISMGNYKKNKKASIDIFPKLPISQANIDLFNSFPDKKKDDVADASLIALYHAQKLEEPPPRPSKRRKKK